MFFKPRQRSAADQLLLARANRFHRATETIRRTRLHLTKDNLIVATEHEIELTASNPPVPIKYFVPSGFVPPSDEVLAPTPQCDP